MSRQYWQETLFVATTSGTAVANSTTETIIMPNFTVPANYMADSRCLRVKLIGQYSTTGTPTLTFAIRWGGVAGTLIAKTAAITLPTITAGVFEMDLLLQVRSNGSTGTILGNGVCRVYAGVAPTVASATGNAAVTPMTAGGTITPATATVDFTADTALSITALWSAASSSNTLTGLHELIEALN